MIAADRLVDSPSSWAHRAPVVLLALLGAGLAAYLALYQWRLTSAVWDPLFGSTSAERVLESPLSRLLPVPDATLGAVGYLVEAVLASVGGEDRWRTLPGLVLVYGAVLAAFALVSLGLLLTQLLLVHAFCSLCLCSAGISWINAWLGREEVFARRN